MTNKMTKKEMFAQILAVVANNADMVAFIEHEIELLDNKSKSPKKPTKVQLENDLFKADILVALSEADKAVTIKELQAICPSIAGLTGQRVSALLSQLRKDGQVRRNYEKKVAYFSLGSESADEQ